MRGFLARCACALAVIFVGSVGSARPAELRVATFRCDVTPPLGFLSYPPCWKPLEKVEHPLLAKGVVLDDGWPRRTAYPDSLRSTPAQRREDARTPTRAAVAHPAAPEAACE